MIVMFDLRKVQINRTLRTPDCELYVLATDQKEGAHRVTTDQRGKKVEEKMDYKLGELVVLYDCDKLDGKPCSRMWLMLSSEVNTVDEDSEYQDFLLDPEKDQLFQTIRKQVGLQNQAIKLVVSRYRESVALQYLPEENAGWSRILSAENQAKEAKSMVKRL
jgi:hypothetical protein